MEIDEACQQMSLIGTQEKPHMWEVILDDNKTVSMRSPTADTSTETEASYKTEEIEEIVEDIVDIENITVKFRLNENRVIAQVYPNRLILGDIKKDIARRFEVDAKYLCLSQCGVFYSDECMLADTCCDEFGIHDFDLCVKKLDPCMSDDQLPQLNIDVYYDKHRLPDFITVHIPSDDPEVDSSKNVVVEIQNKCINKPFLCGYKDIRTGKEYMDAYTQTGPIFDKWKYRRYVSRDTQTSQQKSKIMNTPHEQTTQCFLDGNNVLYVSGALDYTIVARKYQTAAQRFRLEDKCNKILIIQRNWRRVLREREAKRKAAEEKALVAAREDHEVHIKQEKEKRIQREVQAKMFPHTAEDFELLLGEIHKWKQAELKRIASMYDGPARISETNLLLDREIQMLNGLERQKRLVRDSMKEYREEKFLDKIAEPVKWVGYKDLKVDCDLLRTQRARFLKEVYKELKKPAIKEERLVTIRKIKELLVTNEQNFPGFAELFDLLDREKNLLIYTKLKDTDILHQRQRALFKELIEWDESYETTKPFKRMCIVCKKIKPYNQMAVHSRKKVVDTCKNCFYMRATNPDNIVYMAILRSIQREERKKRANKSFAFILQQDDVRYIIDKIWHGHSILSKNENLADLRLPRWIKGDDWAPWNCICLTEAEARDHAEVIDLETVYDEKLRMEVHNKHMLARSVFHTLAAVGTEYFETRQWHNTCLNRQRTVPKTLQFSNDRPTYAGMYPEKNEPDLTYK